MRYSVLAFSLMVIGAALIAGCTQSAPQPATPAPTVAATPVPTTSTTEPSLSLGDHFFQNKYSWQGGSEVYSEQFMVPQGQPWGIGYDITLLNDDPSKCWYEVKVIDVNAPQSVSTFGFGRSPYSSEKVQTHPIYGYGSYKVEMRGNFVMVNMQAAKRNP